MASQIRSVIGPRQVLILAVGVAIIILGSLGLLGTFGWRYVPNWAEKAADSWPEIWDAREHWLLKMSEASNIDQVDSEDVELTEAFLGYNILVDGERTGAIEGVPGSLEHIEVEMHWEGKGVARAALNEFISLSRKHGETTVTTNNATHPAMEHILETEGFEQSSDDIGWEKEV